MNTQSYIKSNVDSIHKDWITTLKDIKAVTNPAALSIYTDHLKELYLRAEAINDVQSLHPTQRGALAHILDRPIDEHLLAIKATMKKNLL